MRCPHCDHLGVPDGAFSCPNCGHQLDLMAALDYTGLVIERTQGFTGREWVFQAIGDWLADPTGARVFLLTGGPGTGKTAIAAQLVRMAEGEVSAEPYLHLGAGSIRLFQFCQAFHNDTLDPLRFTKHLSLNLASAYPHAGMVTMGDTAAGILGLELHLGSLSARVAFDRLVAGLLKQVSEANPTDTILILLDALDEALTYPGETLVDLLGHVLDDSRDLPSQVRFLLTSRPDERVTATLGQPALDLIADAPAGVDDVQVYARWRLQALGEPRHRDLAYRIAQASKGNFLYARYVIDNLPPDPNQVENLAELPLPEDLYDVYRQFLRRELGPSLDTWDNDYAPVLGVLAVARCDGLTIAQLAGVTKQRRTKMRRLLRTCGQYLAGRQPDGPFRIYHQSFREFLREDGTYHVFPQESSKDIADYFWEKCRGKWGECDIYGLRNLPMHMAEAGYNDRLRELVLDHDWQQAKLEATDVTALITDYDLLPGDADAQLVGDALRLAAHVLVGDKAQLWSQLHGRPMVEVSLVEESAYARAMEQVLSTLAGSDAKPRWLQAELYEIAGDGLAPLQRGLRVGAEHRLDVWIGPQQAGAIRAPEVFPEYQLPAYLEIYELQILFWQVNAVPQLQSGKVWLPKGRGTSTSCAFHFRVRADVSSFEGRLQVMYGDRTLQTMLLTAPVLPDPSTAPEGSRIEFRLDTPVRASPAGLDPAQPRGPAFFSDTPSGATPQMTAVAGDRVALHSLEGVDRTIKLIRGRLEQIASAPDAFATLDDAATKKLLRFLARQGRLLYNVMAGTYLQGFHLADDLPIQVVSARESFLPIEFMYDRPAPAGDAELCPIAAAALDSGECTECLWKTEDEAKKYVCPLGFWCMRRVIERHAVRPVAETGLEGAEYALAADPTEGRNTLNVLRSAVCASSDRVRPDDVEALRASLGAAIGEHVVYVKDWTAWRQAVQAGSPSLLVLLPHTLRDDDQIPTLEIGELQQLPEIDITWQDVHGEGAAAPPVVLLLGCETAVPDIPFQNFATQFRISGAAIVLNTLAPVLGRHVVPVAQMLVEELKCAGEAGSTFGKALLEVRRRGLATGLPVVLSLVAYGDADWGIGR